MFKLEKKMKFYKSQFDDLVFERYESHVVDRLGIDLDNLVFLTKYLVKRNKDLDKLDKIEKEFSEISSAMRKVFGEIIRYLVIDKLELGNENDIVDILIRDMKVDTTVMSFNITMISENEEFLNRVNEITEDENIYNLYPDKFFRFTTDSYNDGIAKAFPELFMERKNEKKGIGKDHDVFVHSLTFQTSEGCSLSCFPKGTNILMSDFTHKDISEIQIGDEVLGFEEYAEKQKQRTLIPTKVLATSKHFESCFKISHQEFEKDLYVTPYHPFLTARGDWVNAIDLRPSDGLVRTTIDPDNFYNANENSIEYITGYFISAFMGDGCITKREDKNGYIRHFMRFVVKDREMTDRMKDYSKRLGFDFNIYPFHISTKYDLYQDAIGCCRKSEYEKWEFLINKTFSNKIMMNHPDFLMGTYAGIYDSEGSYDGYIMRIVNTDLNLLKMAEKALNFLNIPFKYDTPREGVNKPLYCLRVIGGVSSVLKVILSSKQCITRKGIARIIGKSVFRSLYGYKMEYVKDAKEVYNFETETHTYIANRLQVHNCTYCIAGDTLIEKVDGSVAFIKDIKKGDKVLAFNESIGDRKGNIRHVKINTNLWAEVTNTMKRKVKGYYLISHPKFRRPLKITGEHPILTEYGWMEVCVLRYDYGIAYINEENKVEFVRDFDITWVNDEIFVYNLETSKSTYIANRFLVHNCYQFNKTPMRMNFNTAKNFIDKLLNDEYGYINRYNSPAIILEFIGGEPLLEINLTRRIYEYFLDKCYELKHPWFKLHRVSICSNGMQYFDKEVQDFFRDYANNISFNISIDGNKELHDACRKQPNGEGSYDIDMLALNHYNKHFTPERNSKMTLAPQNMKYLFESVKSFINNGMNTINLNCVFEEGWNRKTALLEYNELKKLADYILENDLENLYISIFNERQEDVQEKSVDGNFCGAGSASMLAIRPNGQFYPCIRYMPTSIGPDKDDLCMGTVDTKLIGREEGSEIIKMLDRNTRRGQVNDICYNCPIGNDCPSCSALGITVFNDNNKKVTFICIQMIAEALANVYYWNLLSIKHPEYNLPIRKNNIPDEWSLLVIDKEELDFLKKIEIMAMIKKIEENK